MTLAKNNESKNETLWQLPRALIPFPESILCRRRLIDKKYSCYHRIWSWGYNKCPSCPFSALYSNFSSPSAITSSGLSSLPDSVTQTLFLRGLSSHESYSFKPGLLHVSIHSYNQAKKYQEVTKQIVWIPHVFLPSSMCKSSPTSTCWIRDNCPSKTMASFLPPGF